jgi:CRISPR-associated endonuclease/helicase Cas3
LRVRLSPSVYPEILDIPGWDDLSKWKDTVRAMGCDARITGKGVAKIYPAGLVVEVGLWSVQPAKTFRSVPLTDHLEAVGERAGSFARRTNLPEEMIEAVQRAGFEHDTGKEDPAFQLMIGGTPSRLLAKGHGGDGHYLPKGWRHEMLSSNRSSHTALVNYLVGSHHGHGRGILPASPDLDLWEKLGGLMWGATYYQLTEKYGPWRLAYLEALVRLSDWMVSEEEQA